MSHDDKGWNAHYGGPSQGQQYRCILCGTGGASGMDHKPLAYNCHNKACNGQATLWPTPQYRLYREQVLKAERLEKALQSIADGMETEPDVYAGLILNGTL